MTSSTTRGQAQRRPRSQQRSDRDTDTLSTGVKLRLAVLALPTFGLALSITVVSTYLSEVTRRFTHDTVVIGAIIGSEGFMALGVPLIAGAWSDQLRTRIGGRLPLLIAGTVPAAVALALVGLLRSLVLVALGAAAFFAFYFVAYEPYRALYPDLFGEKIAGRAQSTQALARGLGTGCALLGGGLLLGIGRFVPFGAAALVLLGAIGTFVILLLRRGVPEQSYEDAQSPWAVARRLPRLVARHPALRAYFWANALWETALSALKAFVILYLTIGLRYPLSTGSLIVGGVALVILIGAGLAGQAGDRWGKLRVISIALVAYGLGFVGLIFTTSRFVLGAAIPFLAVGGGAVMTLAYAILMPLMPEDEHGALTGFYSMSRGVGIIAGPIIAGILIAVTAHGPFQGTNGFQAMWIVCAAAAFSSLWFVRRLRAASSDREELAKQ